MDKLGSWLSGAASSQPDAGNNTNTGGAMQQLREQAKQGDGVDRSASAKRRERRKRNTGNNAAEAAAPRAERGARPARGGAKGGARGGRAYRDPRSAVGRGDSVARMPVEGRGSHIALPVATPDRRGYANAGQKPFRGQHHGETLQGRVTARTGKKTADGRLVLGTSGDFTDAVLRFIPLGGMEQVTRNMMVYETKNDIVIIEMGLEFPDDEMHGVNYLIPDATYLLAPEKQSKIRAVLITHGHYDHIGAIPHIMPLIGMDIPLYASDLTIAMIEKRQEEFGGKLNTHVVESGSIIRLGSDFVASFYHVNHNIPATLAIALDTPAGTVFQTADWKIDHSPIGDKPAELQAIAAAGGRGVLALMCDALGSESPGYQVSEKKIMGELEQIFIKNRNNRLVFGTYASNLGRVQQVLILAEKYGRHVFVDGRSMKNNVQMSRELGYVQCRPDLIQDIADVNRYAPDRVVVLCTGSQSEENAALTRIVAGNHKFFTLSRGDIIVFTASVQNRSKMQTMYDKIFMQGAEVINHEMMDIHAGGHSKAEEKKLMMNLVSPKYHIPVSGSFFMRIMYGRIAEEMGWAEDSIVISRNADVVEFDAKGNMRILDEKISKNIVPVDGKAVGDESAADVIAERAVMEDNGIVAICIPVDENSAINGPIRLAVRGFLYASERQQVLPALQKLVEQTYYEGLPHYTTRAELQEMINAKVARHFESEMDRVPLVITLVVAPDTQLD